MNQVKNVHGRYYPDFHPGWGGFAEELFHYTSRYYHATELFLRYLAQDTDFTMSGYKAARLSEAQRALMAAALACPPEREPALAATTLVAAVLRNDPGVDLHWQQRFCDKLTELPKPESLVGHPRPPKLDRLDVAPLDPFISLAERLQMPVAVKERHVEICMRTLAKHLDSPNATLRSNLHEAVLVLHNAGFTLRNHPHLTHAEAQENEPANW
jgi:hypothetical protein